MSYEMLVGLQIKDDDLYTKYREAMTPLLKTYGGGFRYDFKVSSVLKNEDGRPINGYLRYILERKSKWMNFSLIKIIR